MLQTAHDRARLEALWGKLEAAEKNLPQVAMAAAGRLLRLGGDAHLALSLIHI